MTVHSNARVAAAGAMRQAQQADPSISLGALAEIAFQYAPPSSEVTAVVEAAAVYFREFNHLTGDDDSPERRALRDALAALAASER